MTGKAYNIAVSGAGIMGLSVAHALGAAGHKVTLYDGRGFPAPNASTKAGGMLAPYSEIEHMNGAWIEAGLAGIAAWAEISSRHDIGFVQAGSFLVAHPEDHYILERFKSHLPAEKKTVMPAREAEPMLAPRFETGLLLAEEAHLNPAQAIKALLEEITAQGATFTAQETDPKTLSPQYDYVFDCRGYGATDDIKTLRGVKGETVIVRNPEFWLSRPVRLMHPRYPLYIVPREDHHFMIGATMIESADDTHVSLRSGLELMSALYSLHPSFGEAHIVQVSAGLRPSYPDNLPRITREGNIIRCNGLFRHGFLLAPVMAQAAVDMIEENTHIYMSLFTGGSDESDHQRSGKNIHRAA